MDLRLESYESISEFLQDLFHILHVRYLALLSDRLSKEPRDVRIEIRNNDRFEIGSGDDVVYVDVSFLTGVISVVNAAQSVIDGADPSESMKDLEIRWSAAKGIHIDPDRYDTVIPMSVSVVAYVMMHDLGHIYLEGEEHEKEIRADVLSAEVIASMINDPPTIVKDLFGRASGCSPLLFWDIGQIIWGDNPFEDCMARKSILKKELSAILQSLPGESMDYYYAIESAMEKMNLSVVSLTSR